MSRIRWKVAYLLNRLSWTCWSDLVTAALGWHPFRGYVRQREMCRTDAERNGSCYCGKVEA